MHGLHELQRDFQRFVLGKSSASVSGIVARGMTPEQRLGIYRNNTRLGLTTALKDVYPVVCRLVGEAFFNQLCQRYLNRHPLRTGCLLSFGDRFADFLEDEPSVAQLPYLSAMARLEWLYQEVFYAEDAEGLDIIELARIPAGQYGQLRFGLHPAVRLMVSDYPVLRIWQANAADLETCETIDLAEVGCWLLVLRSGLEVDMINLQPAEFRFIQGLQAGLTLAEATRQILAEQADFSVQAALQLCLNKSVITHVTGFDREDFNE